MLQNDALNMSIKARKLDDQRCELLLHAMFGLANLTAHRVNSLGMAFFPYHIQYGFTGGEFIFNLRDSRAPITGRLSAGVLPISVSEKITDNSETAASTTESAKDTLGLSAKDFGTAGLEHNKGRTESSKAGETKEFIRARALVFASGPDHRPIWRFEAITKKEPLIGVTPGNDDPPLAILHCDAFPPDVQATFAIKPSDVHFHDYRAAEFQSDWIPKVAVARRALRKGLAKICTQENGTVIIDRQTLNLTES